VLLRSRPQGIITWSTGSAVAYLDEEVEQGRLVVGVRCRIGTLSYDEKALLDTGATYTVLSEDIVRELGGAPGTAVGTIRMSTRHGSKPGVLFRLPIQLQADEGKPLHVDATVAILEKWPGPTVLGFVGFMDRIRLALDPGLAVGEEPTVFFGK